MNHKIRKEFDDFVLEGDEIFCIEKALYALTDKYKKDMMRGNLEFPSNYHEMISKCFAKIRLHENLIKNREVFELFLTSPDDEELASEEGDFDLNEDDDDVKQKAS